MGHKLFNKVKKTVPALFKEWRDNGRKVKSMKAYLGLQDDRLSLDDKDGKPVNADEFDLGE